MYRHLKTTESPAQPVLLQEKFQLRIHRGLIWRSAIRVCVRIRDLESSSLCRVATPCVPLAGVLKLEAESSAKTARHAGLGATAASAARGGGGGAARLPGAQRPALLSGLRRQRGPAQRPAGPGALRIWPARPHRLSGALAHSPTRRPTQRRGPARDAAAGTSEQRSAAAPRPFVTPRANRSLQFMLPSNQAWPSAAAVAGKPGLSAFGGCLQLGVARMLILYL